MSRSKLTVGVLACTLGIALSGCGGPPPYDGPPADLIFFGDNIVTMDPNQPTVEAVAVLGETITAAGTLDEVMAHRGDATRVVERMRERFPDAPELQLFGDR